MVSVKVDFKKRDFVWIGLFAVLLFVGFSYATVYTGSAPDNGHLGDNIWVNFNNTEQTLESALGLLANGVAGGGSLSCVTKATGAFTGTTTVTCDAGYVRAGCSVRTGDSKNADNYFGSEPIAGEGCKFYNGWGSWKNSYGWATCCKAGGSGGLGDGAPNYDSGWQSQTWFPDGHKKITHGLGRMPYLVQVWLSSQPDGMVAEGSTSQWTTTFHVPYGEGRGTYLSGANANDMWIYRDSGYLTDFRNRAGTRITDPGTYYVRVVAW